MNYLNKNFTMEKNKLDELNVYRKSKILRRKFFEVVKSFPPEEKYRLSDQLIRSIRKCPSNIAEGYGRFHFQESIQYCRIARGSLFESIDHIGVAFECNYISNSQYLNLSTELQSLIKMLNGYIKYLQKQKRINT